MKYWQGEIRSSHSVDVCISSPSRAMDPEWTNGWEGQGAAGSSSSSVTCQMVNGRWSYRVPVPRYLRTYVPTPYLEARYLQVPLMRQ